MANSCWGSWPCVEVLVWDFDWSN